MNQVQINDNEYDGLCMFFTRSKRFSNFAFTEFVDGIIQIIHRTDDTEGYIYKTEHDDNNYAYYLYHNNDTFKLFVHPKKF
jgi:hypothetical protein